MFDTDSDTMVVNISPQVQDIQFFVVDAFTVS